MPGQKRKNESSESKSPKYKLLSMEERIEIVEKLKKGVETKSELARFYKTSHTSIKRIWENREKIMEASKSMAECSKSKITRCRSPIVEKMEKMLLIWIENCTSNKIPLDTRSICEKATSLYKVLAIQAGEDPDGFKATNG